MSLEHEPTNGNDTEHNDTHDKPHFTYSKVE
jgi:hypothetical protein